MRSVNEGDQNAAGYPVISPRFLRGGRSRPLDSRRHWNWNRRIGGGRFQTCPYKDPSNPRRVEMPIGGGLVPLQDVFVILCDDFSNLPIGAFTVNNRGRKSLIGRVLQTRATHASPLQRSLEPTAFLECATGGGSARAEPQPRPGQKSLSQPRRGADSSRGGKGL